MLQNSKILSTMLVHHNVLLFSNNCTFQYSGPDVYLFWQNKQTRKQKQKQTKTKNKNKTKSKQKTKHVMIQSKLQILYIKKSYLFFFLKVSSPKTCESTVDSRKHSKLQMSTLPWNIKPTLSQKLYFTKHYTDHNQY